MKNPNSYDDSIKKSDFRNGINLFLYPDLNAKFLNPNLIGVFSVVALIWQTFDHRTCQTNTATDHLGPAEHFKIKLGQV